jgi:phytoene/squalene synthetase
MEPATSQGKSEATENFPVAARFLTSAHRAAVMDFYRAARAADDVADDPDLPADEKVARLDALAVERLPSPHFAKLLQAFRQDATKSRYRDWSDLMLYCRFSAVPVGRFLLDLHGEGGAALPAADALCTALQVLNHLQDCGDDYRMLDRVYLPTAWMNAEGAHLADLGEGRTKPALRRVLDRALDRVDELLVQARPLSLQIGDRRLALQAAITFSVAERLARKLRRRDPLASRIRLSKAGYAMACARGGLRWLLRR